MYISPYVELLDCVVGFMIASISPEFHSAIQRKIIGALSIKVSIHKDIKTTMNTERTPSVK